MLKIIRLDDQSQAVSKLQLSLNAALKLSLKPDGGFGPITEAALKQYQAANDLTADGICGPATIAKLGLDMTPGQLTEEDIADAARGLGITYAHLKAIAVTESAAEGFLPDGRPILLYERHEFFKRAAKNRSPRYLGKDAEYAAAFKKFCAENPDICQKARGGYLGLAKEYTRLERAMVLSETSALESCSWGMFQIMGYHATNIGYKSVQAFYRAMQASEDDQLFAVIKFIQADPRLLKALKTADWTTFARIYNGPRYAENKYDVKMAKAFVKYSGPAYAALNKK